MHRVLTALLAAGLLIGCSKAPNTGPIIEPEITIPAKGTATTLDVATWNLEWFGDASNGPADENRQFANVRTVMKDTDADIWSVQEVVARFDSLKGTLPGYSGVLANDPAVIDGPAYYSDFNNREQKVGILWKSSVATLLEARVILGAHDYDFGGRPPLQAKLRVSLNGTTEDIVVIALHMKCCADSASWARRQNAGAALKAYLDTAFATQKVFVVGDWNDDVDTSIWTGHASPYQLFVDAAATWQFPTSALSQAGKASTVDYPDTIDHHLVSNEAAATLVTGSAEAYRVDSYITGYGTNTSDHYPVIVRYNF